MCNFGLNAIKSLDLPCFSVKLPYYNNNFVINSLSLHLSLSLKLYTFISQFLALEKFIVLKFLSNKTNEHGDAISIYKIGANFFFYM